MIINKYSCKQQYQGQAQRRRQNMPTCVRPTAARSNWRHLKMNLGKMA